MANKKPAPDENVAADVNLVRCLISEDQIDDMIEFDIKPGKNRLVIRLRPTEYVFSA